MTKDDVVRAMERVRLRADRSNERECYDAARESVKATGHGEVISEDGSTVYTISIPKTDYECKEEACVGARAECERLNEALERMTRERDSYAHSDFERQLSEAREECERLRTRRDELLALVANLSQSVPLESEVAEALNQRGALLAEVGTLRADRDRLRRLLSERIDSEERVTAERDAYRAMLADLVAVHDEHGESHSGYWDAARELLKNGPTTHDETEPHHGE